MKKIITFFIIIMLITITPNDVFALKDESELSIDISGIQIGTTDSVHTATSTIETVLGTLQTIGSVCSVIALVIIGLRYMLSSLEEKANMKGVLIYYVVGAVLVFATSNVVGLFYDIITKI